MNSSINSLRFSRTKRLWIAGLLGSMIAIGPLSLDMYLPSLPILTKELNTSVSLGQLSLSACLSGLALGQLWIGPLSDSIGRKKVLLIGLVVYAIASVSCAFVSNIWLFIVFRFLQGLAGSAGIVISRAAARDLYGGSDLTKFFSLLMLVNGAAPVLAPIIGGQLLVFTDWKGIFFLLGLIGSAMVVATFFGLPETLPNELRS
jgi:DHA1 family bicyclomycin/chloramphenicol resistance-like MFS transporter